MDDLDLVLCVRGLEVSPISEEARERERKGESEQVGEMEKRKEK
jgi:hypothetical protein